MVSRFGETPERDVWISLLGPDTVTLWSRSENRIRNFKQGQQFGSAKKNGRHLDSSQPHFDQTFGYHLHMRVTVRGDGVAGRCGARLLEGEDFCVTLQRQPRPKLPAIMIGGATQRLFRDAFGQHDLFGGLPAITRRIVAWGPDCDPRVLPHSAVVANEQDLLDKLQPSAEAGAAAHEAAWTVVASQPLPDACIEHFGARTARAVQVRLREGVDRSACWVESLQNGWLFLIPDTPATGWLLAVGDLGEAPLGSSRLVGARSRR